MVKPHELRIGNILIDGQGRICKVTEINELEFKAWPINNGPITTNPHTEVPLTEEMILKLGFLDKSYKPGYIGIDIQHTDFVLTKPDVESNDITLKYYSFHCKYGGWPRYMPFKYVHELQNFFFALHNEELKFKL